MNVSLTPDLESFVKEKLSSGMYGSASEVIREALRLLQTEDAMYQARLEALRQDLHAGQRALDRGDSVDGAKFMTELKSSLAKNDRRVG